MRSQDKTRHPHLRFPLFLLSVFPLAVIIQPANGQNAPTKPSPVIIDLKMNSSEYQEVLGGPPKSVSMESGLVTLAPSKSDQKHSTKKYEEILVVFSGTGEMRITEKPPLNLKPNIVAYCPPMTEHYIANTGSEPLRYLYVAAKAQP